MLPLLPLLLWGCKGPPPTGASDDDPNVPAVEERVWSQVTLSPCALDQHGLVECWESSAWDEIHEEYGLPVPPRQIPVSAISRDTTLLWGVDAVDGSPVDLMPWPGGALPLPPNMRDPQDLTTYCGRVDTIIRCWGVWDQPSAYFPADRTYVRLGGISYTAVALDDQHTLHSLNLPDGLVTHEIPTTLEVVAIAQTRGGGCVLDALGAITCFGGHEGFFDHGGPWERVLGGGDTVCGQRAADHVVTCTDGSTFDWGPLRDLVVADYSWYERTEPGAEDAWERVQFQPGDPPHVCAITTSNAIRCAGPRYDFPDLQAALPAGD